MWSPGNVTFHPMRDYAEWKNLSPSAANFEMDTRTFRRGDPMWSPDPLTRVAAREKCSTGRALHGLNKRIFPPGEDPACQKSPEISGLFCVNIVK